MNKHFYYLVFCCPFLLLTYSYGQQIIANAGSTLQNANGSVAFTLGELVIDTRTASTKTLTQGFHQPKINITAINELTEPGCSIAAYPNPTSDWVKLTIEKSTTKDMEYALYDQNGELLSTKKMDTIETQIPFTSFSPAIYFLKVKVGGKEVKTFKIVKQ